MWCPEKLFLSNQNVFKITKPLAEIKDHSNTPQAILDMIYDNNILEASFLDVVYKLFFIGYLTANGKSSLISLAWPKLKA